MTVLTLCAIATADAAAQRRWQSEVGIQGGWSRVKPTGTGASDAIDIYDVPGAGVLDAVPTYGTVFFLIPWTDRIALEPSVRVAQTTPALFFTNGTFVTLGLRGNYAVTRSVYAALGGLLAYSEATGTNERQVGLQAGLGYRIGLASGTSGRIEAHATTMRKSDNAGPFNVYSVLFGVSTRLAGAGAPSPARTQASGRAWTRVLGIAAGYSRMHIVGGDADLAVLSFPGSGATGVAGIVAPGAPTLFVLWPLGGRLALESGLDAHQYNANGEAALTAQLAPRLNYAIVHGWYAGAGPTLHLLKTSSIIGVAGAQTAFGYRFQLTGSVGGRVELNYIAYKERSDIGQAANMFGVTFGVLMPLR